MLKIICGDVPFINLKTLIINKNSGIINLNELKKTLDRDKLFWKDNPKTSFTLDVTHCDELDNEKRFKEFFDGMKLVFHGKREV